MKGRSAGWRSAGLVLIAGLSLYYLYRAVAFRFLAPAGLAGVSPERQLGYGLHLLFALPVVLGAPLQFLPGLRARRPALHRGLGRAYAVGAIGAALTALLLGATIAYEGSRLSIVLTSLVWLFFTVTAWRLARARQWAAHRAFMIRSYTMALVLVWLRLMGDADRWLFFYVQDEAMRDVTREWASWVVPLLIVEAALQWAPAWRAGQRQ